MIDSRSVAAVRAIDASSASSGARSESSMRSRLPMTPFIGVRISWLMVAKNSDLTTDARSAASRASASLRSAALRSVMSRTKVTKNCR